MILFIFSMATKHFVKIPTRYSDTNLVLFDWSRTSGKWLLYIDKLPEPEFRNYFLGGDFQDTQLRISDIDEQAGIK